MNFIPRKFGDYYAQDIIAHFKDENFVIKKRMQWVFCVNGIEELNELKKQLNNITDEWVLIGAHPQNVEETYICRDGKDGYKMRFEETFKNEEITFPITKEQLFECFNTFERFVHVTKF